MVTEDSGVTVMGAVVTVRKDCKSMLEVAALLLAVASTGDSLLMSKIPA